MFGWHLGVGTTFSIFILTKYMRSLVRKKLRLFPFFIHSLDVTQHQVFMEKVKNAWEAWKSFPDATTSFPYMQLNVFTFNKP